MEIFCMFWRCHIVQHLYLMFEKFVNEKLVNVTNMKQNEDFVLFGNRKDFNSLQFFPLNFNHWWLMDKLAILEVKKKWT